MLKNYLKVAIRNIRKNKLYAGLNILGLSVGLSSFFIIYLFIQNELAYDQFHEKKDRVYRVIENVYTGDGYAKEGSVTGALAPVATEQIPEIQAFTRLYIRDRHPVFIHNVKDSIDEVNSIIVDSGFFNIFSIEPAEGTSFITVDAPNSILISKSKAELYYGTTDVLNRVIKVRNDDLLISGVFNDLPNTSSFKGDMLLLANDPKAIRGNSNWRSTFGQTYFLLNPQAKVDDVTSKINDIYIKNLKTSTDSLSLQALSDIHFSLDVDGPVAEKSDRRYVLIFTLVAIFILVCAVFNYISLALSQSLERFKEIGVRKVVGAKMSSLYSQFIIESVFHVLASFIMAMVLVEILTPRLELLAERNLDISIFDQPILLLKGLAFSLLIGVLAVLYPALLSIKTNVVGILRKDHKTRGTKGIIGAITVLQIFVFIVLTCVAVTTNKQVHFMRNDNLGFDQEDQLVIDWVGYNVSEILKNEISSINGVVSVSQARTVPTKWEGWMDFKEVSGRFHLFDIDEDYLETMGMTLVEGRNFRPDETDSSNVIIINEAAAKKVAPEGSALGKTLPFTTNLYPKGDKRIVGIVKDFHYVSKREIIEPALFQPVRHYRMLIVKLSDSHVAQTMDLIRETYKLYSNGAEMDYYFLDNEVRAQYKQEHVMIVMINAFMALAGVVAFIGLFGIAGYAAKRRIKEVGIRKVLGAGFMSLQVTLNRANLKKIALAALLGIPILVYWMDSWLNSFAYRIELPYGLIFIVVLLASAVLLLTASIHSIKAYLINPVEILKDE